MKKFAAGGFPECYITMYKKGTHAGVGEEQGGTKKRRAVIDFEEKALG